MKKRGKAKSRAQNDQQFRRSAAAVDRLDAIASCQPMLAEASPALVVARLPVGLSWTARGPQSASVVAFSGNERHKFLLMLLPFLIAAVPFGINQTLQPSAGLIEAAMRLPAPVSAITAPIKENAAAAQLPPRPVPEVQRDELPPAAVVAMPAAPFALPPSPPVIAVPPAPSQMAALIVPSQPSASPPVPPQLAAPQDTARRPTLEVCEPVTRPVALASPPRAAEFGVTLARAAEAQTGDFVIYSANYKRMAYPMGDIPSLYGSCSDVVIRAYRALGVDLQELVQRAGVGRGDPNIDHRRTDTLRIFFSKHGELVPPSPYGEDYKPGDIVTYYRPYSRVSRAHIAIVSENIGPSGNPMIVHNRGWGPQREDALFVDRMTGHYRFAGAPYLQKTAGRMVDQVNPPAKSNLSLPIWNTVTVPVTPKRAGIDKRLR